MADPGFTEFVAMRRWEDFVGIHLYRDPVDLRKGGQGLSGIVEQEFEFSLKDQRVFLFCNKRRTLVKAIYWHRIALAVWMIKLEKKHFHWPKLGPTTLSLSGEQIQWLLEGIDLTKIKPIETVDFERFF